MVEPNDRLRRARERVESPNATGQPLSRQELAELVNAWVYENTKPPRVIATDANYLGQLERGRIRWPQDRDRRAGFRAVLSSLPMPSWVFDDHAAVGLPWPAWTVSSSSGQPSA